MNHVFGKQNNTNMDESDALVGMVYNFKALPHSDQIAVISNLTRSINKGNNLKWPAHRCSYVIELCKELANVPMSQTETKRLLNIRKSFEDISSAKHLDLCLMFWQITSDLRYWQRIKDIASDPSHNLHACASTIIKNK